jgi:hypothetical protein
MMQNEVQTFGTHPHLPPQAAPVNRTLAAVSLAGHGRVPASRNAVVAAQNPGHCECSSFMGMGCSNSQNACNPGYVPSCSCGMFGNGCNCVPGSD